MVARSSQSDVPRLDEVIDYLVLDVGAFDEDELPDAAQLRREDTLTLAEGLDEGEL